mgnify:CR=1 FL=1
MSRPPVAAASAQNRAAGGFTLRSAQSAGEIVMTVDEYEVIRLVDYEKRTHEQCAAQMGISRTTVTEIYENARFKLSDGLVNGKALVIDGGHYRVCQGNRERGCGRNCRWTVQAKKGEATMRIAVPYENGQVFQHFGHTSQMKIYDAENGNIIKEQIVDTTGSGHGALAGFLTGLNVDVLICGGIGGGAQQALAQAGIKLYGGVAGAADDAVKNFLAGTLNYSADVRCEHHGQHGGCGEDKHGCAGNGGNCGG